MLVLGRRGALGLPLPELPLPLPRWGGREEGAELSDASLGTGRGPRAESRGSEAHWGRREAMGRGRAASKEIERAILLHFGLSCWALLNWDHKLYMILSPSQNKCNFLLSNVVPQVV